MPQTHNTDFDADVAFDAMPLDADTFPSCFWCWLPLITDAEVASGCHAACADDIDYHCKCAETRH